MSEPNRTDVHTEIGNRDGVIVEIRPEDRADDPPQETDLTHLPVDEAAELYEQLGDALEGEPTDPVDDPWPIAVVVEVTSGHVNAVNTDAQPEYLMDHPSADLYEHVKGKALQKTEGGEVSLSVYESGEVEVTDVNPFNLETDGGTGLPESHQIRAKTRGDAHLKELPDPNDPHPTLEWEYGGRSTQHYTCSCGEPLDDSARSVVEHLLDVGAYDGEPFTDGGVDTVQEPTVEAIRNAVSPHVQDPETAADIIVSIRSEIHGLEWEEKAHDNVQKWGLQSPDALLLAMGEEMGELAGEVHAPADYPGADGEDARMAEQGRDLIRRMDQLGRDIRDYLETVSEQDGQPVPPHERPNYLTVFPEDLTDDRRERLIRAELDDLMALGFQFKWSLERSTEVEDSGE